MKVEVQLLNDGKNVARTEVDQGYPTETYSPKHYERHDQATLRTEKTSNVNEMRLLANGKIIALRKLPLGTFGKGAVWIVDWLLEIDGMKIKAKFL